MTQSFLSIVIPLYNEEKRIHHSFTHLKRFLKKYSFKTEIIFVDDGSSDNSESRIQNSEFRRKYEKNIKLISYQPNRGKGYALKQGVKKATGKWILLVDADMSIPLSEFDKFLPKLSEKYQCYPGTRNEHSRVKAHQSMLRRLFSRGFRLISYVLTGVGAKDITCGFKVFESCAAKKLFGNLHTNRWAYDTEVFMRAKKENFRILPIAIDWQEDDGTTINVLPAIIGSLTDLVKMRVRR